ncbi:FRG domain-containing protein [Aeromonas veronii]|uniref:FRG domain-containing protein n=1 Tax=Aeromonas TaxID=642 RepID=UPI001C22C055|nr:FRG domain-containing protein [Aeromonas sp. FDAARGOS 1419]QWZ77226.1 FRG domain-containing protein [Aeromonas sp. FDAARGOS 1419]
MKIISSSWVHPDAIHQGSFSFDCGHSCPIIRVESIHALNQVVGYVKFLNKSYGEVYFRGQCELYRKLLPSIYRYGTSNSSVATRNQKISTYINTCASKMPCISNINVNVREPLLQHYGIKTRWLDLVDNLWIALWFSIHKYKTSTHDRTYEYVYARDDDASSAYILMVFSDADIKSPITDGYYVGKTTELVDLRVAAPSIFLRPHAQHAILIKPRINQNIQDVDLAKNVCLAIEMNVGKIKEWLGSGLLISSENIYPPPVFDNGYSILLEKAPHNKADMKNFGSITSMSFSSQRI